jgi:hypothetical protein
MKKILCSSIVLVFILSGCSKPAAGQELAKAACQAWQTAWSNSIRLYAGDAGSQYYDFDAAYDIAKSASDINQEWKPISGAISSHLIYLIGDFDQSLFPDTKKQVEGMNVCEKIGVDVNDI